MGQYLTDRLGTPLAMGSRVKFRSWQGSDVFFNGVGHIQNIDPFGNVYVEPDSAMTIEGEQGFFDATVLMVSTTSKRLAGDEGDEKSGLFGYKEHVVGEQMVGVSWLEKAEESKRGW
jgi:hypothetical protein